MSTIGTMVRKNSVSSISSIFNAKLSFASTGNILDHQDRRTSVGLNTTKESGSLKSFANQSVDIGRPSVADYPCNPSETQVLSNPLKDEQEVDKLAMKRRKSVLGKMFSKSKPELPKKEAKNDLPVCEIKIELAVEPMPARSSRRRSDIPSMEEFLKIATKGKNRKSLLVPGAEISSENSASVTDPKEIDIPISRNSFAGKTSPTSSVHASASDLHDKGPILAKQARISLLSNKLQAKNLSDTNLEPSTEHNSEVDVFDALSTISHRKRSSWLGRYSVSAGNMELPSKSPLRTLEIQAEESASNDSIGISSKGTLSAVSTPAFVVPSPATTSKPSAERKRNSFLGFKTSINETLATPDLLNYASEPSMFEKVGQLKTVWADGETMMGYFQLDSSSILYCKHELVPENRQFAKEVWLKETVAVLTNLNDPTQFHIVHPEGDLCCWAATADETVHIKLT